uniref:protein phosphatase 1 regulatory subunit 27 isoform X2 n=1 Tax=Macaca mulatta TaxID=9544 RepID=UPI0010A1FA42|nr:protein phosphatase 1 regulatory subunit 27 isoform X2 [Macaca mulatta]
MALLSLDLLLLCRGGNRSSVVSVGSTEGNSRGPEDPAGLMVVSEDSPRQRRRRMLADRSVRFPNDVLFLDHIRQGDLEQVRRFIRAQKVSLATIHPSGLAALHEAVLSGNLECVKLLVKYGADIHQRDEAGWTPLHIACSDGYPDIASGNNNKKRTLQTLKASGILFLPLSSTEPT